VAETSGMFRRISQEVETTTYAAINNDLKRRMVDAHVCNSAQAAWRCRSTSRGREQCNGVLASAGVIQTGRAVKGWS